MLTFTPTITSFEGYADDNVEGSATSKNGVDGNWTQAVDENFRTRLLVLETNAGSSNNVDFQFQYYHTQGTATWTNITTTSSVVKAVTSTHITDDADTTQQIGSGTFITPNSGFTEDGLVSAIADFAGSDETEVEAVLQLVRIIDSISKTIGKVSIFFF